MSIDATLIIPQYNHSNLTRDCLRSLTQWESAPVEVVVVDDGSTPQCRAQIESLSLPHMKVVAQPHTGVSAAWNRGAAAATSSYLVFLNNDTLFHGPVIQRLLAPLRSGLALLAGSSIRRETALPKSILRELPTEQFLQGWCVAVSRDDFCDLGGFDEAMSLYWSDTDFQARLLKSHGVDHTKLAAVSQLPLRHQSHQTTRHLSDRRRIWRDNRETFIRKWASR